MHKSTFKMPTMRQAWKPVQLGDYAFPVDLKDDFLHIPIVKHYHHFIQFSFTNVITERLHILAGYSP